MVEIGTLGELVEAIGTAELPGDLIIQILLRLPALSILRFKSVCRFWLALFNLPTFIQNHTRMALLSSKKNQQPSSFIVISQFIQDEDDLFSFVRFPFLGEPVNLHLPFDAKPMSIDIVGSINGLVCINLHKAEASIVLWNPATREYNFIPEPELHLFHEECNSYGFAYDDNTDCYKVIRIIFYKSRSIGWMPTPFKAEVYSTKTNTWTQVEVGGDFPFLHDHKSCCNVISGCPYWFACEPDEKCRFISGQVLMWFDASNDSFGFRRLPQGWQDGYGEWSVKTGLGVEEDCPVAVAYSKPLGTKYSMAATHKIVKLKKCDGDEEDNPIGEEDFDMTLDSSKMRLVVGFWGTKILALDMEWKLCVYDRHSAKLRSFAIWGDSTVGGIDVLDYTESLVSPSAVA